MTVKWANFREFDENDLKDIENFLKNDEKDWAGRLNFKILV